MTMYVWLVLEFILVDSFVHGCKHWRHIDIVDLTFCCNKIYVLLPRRKPFQRESICFITAGSLNTVELAHNTSWAFSLGVGRGFAVFGSECTLQQTAHLHPVGMGLTIM